MEVEGREEQGEGEIKVIIEKDEEGRVIPLQRVAEDGEVIEEFVGEEAVAQVEAFGGDFPTVLDHGEWDRAMEAARARQGLEDGPQGEARLVARAQADARELRAREEAVRPPRSKKEARARSAGRWGRGKGDGPVGDRPVGPEENGGRGWLDPGEYTEVMTRPDGQGGVVPVMEPDGEGGMREVVEVEVVGWDGRVRSCGRCEESTLAYAKERKEEAAELERKRKELLKEVRQKRGANPKGQPGGQAKVRSKKEQKEYEAKRRQEQEKEFKRKGEEEEGGGRGGAQEA